MSLCAQYLPGCPTGSPLGLISHSAHCVLFHLNSVLGQQTRVTQPHRSAWSSLLPTTLKPQSLCLTQLPLEYLFFPSNCGHETLRKPCGRWHHRQNRGLFLAAKSGRASAKQSTPLTSLLEAGLCSWKDNYETCNTVSHTLIKRVAQRF